MYGSRLTGLKLKITIFLLSIVITQVFFPFTYKHIATSCKPSESNLFFF